LVILLFVSPAFAAEEEVCFTVSAAKEMLVELEKGRIVTEQLETYKQMNVELEKQIVSLNNIIALQKQQLEMSQKMLDNYSALLKTQSDAYEKQIKESKPSFWEQAGKFLGAVGLGVLIGLAL
jgi:uncharacterized coiled-coil protein SlyX